MNAPPPPGPTPAKPEPAQPSVVDVRDLLGDSREIILMHQGERYRLRITARERLILTK